jgi:hypothetical protein
VVRPCHIPPVAFSGIASVVDMFASDLKRLRIQPIAGIGGGSNLGPDMAFNEETLSRLVGGRATFAGTSNKRIGTVTYRNSERIYAFGHPPGLRNTSWPMAESSVITAVRT